VASLNYKVSEASIIGDLKKIQDTFNNAGGLKIGCTINSDSLKTIQSQLGKLSQGVTFNVGNTNLEGLNNSIRQTADTVNGANQRVQQLVNSLADLDAKYSNPLKAVIDTEGFVKAEETMRKLKAQLSDLGEVSVQGFYGDTNGVNKLEKMVATVKSAYGELRTLTFELGDNDLFRFISGKFDNDGIRKQTEEITKFVDQYTSKLNSLKAKVGENFAPNISATIGEDINKTIVTFDSFEKKLAELKSGKGSIEELRAEFVALDGTVSNLGSLLRGGDSSLNQFTNATIKVRNFANDLKALEVEFENLSTVTKGDKLFSSLADAEQKLVNLQNIQKNEGYTENWIKQYQELSVAIKQATEDVKLAKKLEQQDASSATKKQADALREVASAYKEINQYTKTLYSTSATDVEKGLAGAHRGNQYALIEQIKQRLESEGLLDDVLKQEIQNYEAIAKEIELIAKSRRDATQAHREEVEAEKAKKQNLQDVNKLINDNIKSLEKFNNSTVAKNNASNPTVVSQTGLNADLINQLRGLQESLANDKSPENIARITARMNELGGSLRDAKFNSEALDQSLRDESSVAKLNANISKLTNQMDIFANTNRKATESLRLMRDGETTFVAKWQELTAAIHSGNLSAEDLRRLSDEFRVFRGEADAAGLTVSRFFQSMQSQLRMVLQRWISLYAVIGYIRKMIDNVKELDNAMINLRRVTNETDAGYQRFLEDANKLARQMKTTTASLVEMSYQWSKLGYEMNEALELSKASTIFIRVADVGQDQALSNLVTSLKAFRLGASQTMDVVDKLDKLNNEYAVSASGLGQGLERSASAMAMTGNTLEETLAMLTGAGEITQNLENTGNALRVISLRLQNMKGKLEELGEPVDDLMEVSKVQTQILNLTHNQVDIIDQNTGEFRNTYQILEDIAKVWDSLNSQSRSSLLEIIAGKNRANVGSALIQAFQSGQIQSAFEDAQSAAGTATEEYNRMMQGIQAQLDAFKGAFQEFSNAFINSDFLKGLVKFGTQFIQLLTTATDKVGSLVVVLTPLLMYFGAKTRTNIFTAIINGFKGLIAAEAGAITATGALSTAVKVLGGALSGLAIGAIIAGISYLADKLIVTAAETEESIREATSAVGDLAKATEELEKSQADIENIAQSYSKIATTVGDVNERKTQLLELQGQLTDKFKEEANGIDLVNGKYSDQIRQLQKLEEEQRKQYELENADKIARARRLANLRVDDIYEAQASAAENGYVRYSRDDDKKGERALFTIRDIDERVARLTTTIDGAYASLQGTFDAKGIYLSGTLEDARNQLKQIIDNYSKLSDVDSETLSKLTQRYKELNDALNEIKEVAPYIENIETKPLFTGMFDGVADEVNQFASDISMQPFYDKLDEAQEKLRQLATPDGLTISEYDTLYHDVQNLERELYKMAGDSESSKQKVADLFGAFKQGVAENGDNLEKFVEQFNTTLEESFKEVSEVVTGVQDALSKLADGEGLSHSEAWKLLKADTDGYLQSIKLVNGEYYLSQKELLKFKDAKIKASIEDLKASNEQYKQDQQTQLARLEGQKEELKLAMEMLNLKASQGLATQKEIQNINILKIAISETESNIKRLGDLWSRNNLLIDELSQNLGEARTVSLAVETDLNNAVKQFEAEVDAIDNAIDSLNDRKEVLQDEKSILQDQLDALNEQKKTIEDTLATYDRVGEAVDELVKAQVDGIQAQIDALEEERKSIEDYYEEQLDALKEQNEERDDAIEKEEALANLANAQNQKKRVYSSDRGWDYEASKADILKAQNELAKIANNEQIKMLENERDAKLAGYDDRKKEYETQIKEYEDYASKYTSISNDIKIAENELLAAQILGSDWREKIEQKDESLLTNYRAQYTSFNEQLNNLTNNEIATLQASIDAKDEEIKKIDDEIAAYNKYKRSVEKSLNDAKTALENYKNSMNDAKAGIISASNEMENSVYNNAVKMQQWMKDTENVTWENHNKIIRWYSEIGDAAEELQNRLRESPTGFGIVNSAWDARLAGYADGGVNTSTGIAMLHGTKQKGEVIFNASDSKKLYDMIHGTPNLLADVVKQANKITGFSPVNSTNTNSVSVSIGQIVANNPQEFTRGLDVELDKYFRRKLTESYVQ